MCVLKPLKQTSIFMLYIPLNFGTEYYVISEDVYIIKAGH